MTSTPRRLLAASGSIALGLAFVGLTAAPASAATYSVSSPTESALTTAINDANANPGLDTITITATGTVTLTADLPAITDTVQIVGPGADQFTIDANGHDAFVVQSVSGTPSISGLRITGASGDGIYAADTNLTLDDITVNDSADDGLRFAPGNPPYVLLISDSDFSSNSGDGAEIDLAGAAAVRDSITNSTFSSNGGEGLHLKLRAATGLDLTNITATENAGTNLYLDAADSATLDANTVVTTGSATARGIDIDNGAGAIVEFTDVTATGNAGDNVHTDVQGSSKLTLTNVDGSESTDSSGVYFGVSQGGKLSVDGLVTNDNASSGLVLEVKDSGVLGIDDLTTSSNGEGGVELSVAAGADVDLSNGTISDNTDYPGLSIDAQLSGHVDITGYSITGSGGDGITASLAGSAHLTVAQSTIADNSDTGVEIDMTESAALDVDESTISGNGSSGFFASIDQGTRVGITNSTISGNTTGSFGPAALEIDGAAEGEQVTILLSTIVDNIGAFSAPGVWLDNIDSLTIDHSIIAGHDASDLLIANPQNVTVAHSLVEVSADANTTTALSSGTGNIVGVDPELGDLADNGGPTLTHLPQIGSPVVDAGDAASITDAPATDQRGESRVAVDEIDLGAVEATAAELTPPTTTDPASDGDPSSVDELPDTGVESGTMAILGGLLLTLGALALAVRRRRAVA
ncbi:right-handed parallel beta-helix repeat-containing protein [Homoserinibacter sp. GY 40078]|uniref:right-handed parallel beta-helix repeat-containing protein n=1 Tax=Homoserinibacter sp. GY 40078 TaxID=2603275 RepID=UPI0011C99FB0|nr:right-handed parallel beta-helix repeat-containing protein [Homoserinibacter sp. GY 40078]TXK18839.1 right-handed parallel beta-helix repeat-containing protein [Homoserinibacter sp. GY 40078]